MCDAVIHPGFGTNDLGVASSPFFSFHRRLNARLSPTLAVFPSPATLRGTFFWGLSGEIPFCDLATLELTVRQCWAPLFLGVDHLPDSVPS